MENNGRRNFLGICLGGMAAVAAGGIAYPVYRYLAPRAGKEQTEKVVIREQDVQAGEARFFEYAGSAAVLVRTGAGGLVALSAVCTHLGCIVQWEKEKQELICPCHGGRFSAAGSVTAGPPPRPLVKLPLRVADGNITIG